ncbi:kinase-like domain, phloem protein 2-like protein [Tanacetum coccineum]
MESSNSNSKERELQLTQRLAKQRHSHCMAWFEQLETHLHDLYLNSSPHAVDAFKLAFHSFFGEEHQTFRLKMFCNLDQLRLQLEKENLLEVNPRTCLDALRIQFKEFFSSKRVNSSEHLNQCWQKDFKEYMFCEPDTYRRDLLENLDTLEAVIHRAVITYGRLQLQSQDVQINPVQAVDDSLNVSKSSWIELENHNALSKSVNETQLQQHESLVTESTTLEANLNSDVKALDAGSVITESSETKSDMHDTSSSSRTYITHVVDANIRPVNDQVPSDEVHLTALHNVLANEQHHTDQSEPRYETYLLEKVESNTTPDSTNMSHRGGEIDQDAKQDQVKSPLLKAEFFKSRDMDAPEFCEFFEINDLKAQLQAKTTLICNLKNQIKSVKEASNEAKVKHGIDVLNTINIELESSVAKLLAANEQLHKENEHLKQTYKELYDSIKKTRIQNKDNSESLTSQINQKSVENADLKAQIQEKVFANVALKNELRKLKGNSVDTKFAKPSILGKPVLQPPRNQSVVRQPLVRNSQEELYGSNDMDLITIKRSLRHKKEIRIFKTCVMPSVRLQNTANGEEKPQGKIFTTVGLKWIPTGKLFDSCTSKVDSEPPNGSNDDIITHIDADRNSSRSLSRTADFEIDFEGFQNGCQLQVAGFEFRPLEENVELYDQCSEEYQDIVKVASQFVFYKSSNELKELLSIGFHINNHKTWFSLNENGEHCEMLSIAHCLISREGGYSFYHTERYSRFPHFYRTNKEGFKVHMRTQLLTPSIRYTVNLVFCKVNIFENEMYVALRYKLEGETETSIVYIASPTKDGHSYIVELYQFTSDARVVDLEIVFEDHNDDLEVEGILFQPLEKVEDEQLVEDQKLSYDSLQWTMKKDLSTNLLKWFHINRSQEGYAVDKNRRKYLMSSARGVIRSDNVYFKSSRESRFREVAMITKHGFKIRKQIKSEKLSRDVRYAVYLVYKLTQEQSKFEAPLKIVDYNIEYKYAPDCIYLLNPLDTPFIGKHLDQDNQNPINRPKLKAGVPLQRSDGWMEVELSEFKVTLNYSYIHLELMHRPHKDFSGLMIQGIEVRPI